MKVTKGQKEKTRRKLLVAAVELIEERGYKSTSMKMIARKAGVGDATIYKYFPVKERILLEYYVLKTQDVEDEVRQVESLEEFSLQEKIQLFLETYLRHLLADREFVQESLEMIYRSPQFLFQKTFPIKKGMMNLYEEFLKSAIESGEVKYFPMQSMLPEMLVEYTFAIIFYWLKDESEEFTDTTQVIDLSLALGMTILSSDIISRSFDLLNVLLKGQIIRLMEHSSGALNSLRMARSFFGDR